MQEGFLLLKYGGNMIDVTKEEINESMSAINDFVQSICELRTRLDKSKDFPDLTTISVYSNSGIVMASISPVLTVPYDSVVAMIQANVGREEIRTRLIRKEWNFEWENHESFLEKLKLNLIQLNDTLCAD